MVVWHLKQIGKLKKWKVEKLKSLISGCFMSCLQRKKIHLFEVLPSLILHSGELLIDQVVMYDENWILYNQQQPAQ